MPKMPSHPPPISEQLRKAVRESGLTVNAVAVASGITTPVLWRFMADGNQHRDILMERTADKLAAYFGLELAPKGAAEKPPAKRKKRG